MAGHMTVTEAVQGFLLYRQTTCAPTTARNEAVVLRRRLLWLPSRTQGAVTG